MNVSYDNTHRAFLQHMLAEQTTTFEAARSVLADIQTIADPSRPVNERDVTEEDFQNYVDTINAAISSLDLEVRHMKDQRDRETVFALVNVQDDALTRMATVHTPDEIAFVKRVLDAMFITNNSRRAEVMAVTSMQAIKLHKASAPHGQREPAPLGQSAASTGPIASITQAQAETVLETLLLEGWLQRNGSGFYWLSPRALMELRTWLVETYNGHDQNDGDVEDTQDGEEASPHRKIKFCQACRDLVTIGQRCPTSTCESRLHKHCVEQMFRAQGGRRECPLCRSEWADAPPVGPKAARSSRRSGTSGGLRSN